MFRRRRKTLRVEDPPHNEELPQGLAKAREVAEACGITINEIYYTMGQYDAIAIAQAPNDEAMAKFLLAFGQLGWIRTQTLKVFTADQFVQLIRELP